MAASFYWSPQGLICFHLTLLLASSYVTPSLSMSSFTTSMTLWSSFFPPAWKLCLYYALSSISTLSSALVQTVCLTPVFSNLVHPGHSPPARPPVFLSAPPSPNQTSQQVSLPSWKPSLSLLQLSFCHTSPLTLSSILPALSSSFFLWTVCFLGGWS